MDTHSRNQYLKTLLKKRQYYSGSKEKKSMILDEYCALTGHNRSYAIRKINTKSYLRPTLKKKRTAKYVAIDIEILFKIWRENGFPCGQSLEKILKSMRVTKIKEMGGEKCDYATAKKLKKITSSTIDLRLRPKKRYYRSQIYSNKKSRTNINQSGKKLAPKTEAQKSSFWRFFIDNI